MTQILASHLKSGGALLIADRLKSATSHKIPASFPAVPEGIITRSSGFSEAEMREIFEGAGLVQAEFRHALSEMFDDVTMELFVAKGVKAT